jgi:hypothetical protein
MPAFEAAGKAKADIESQPLSGINKVLGQLPVFLNSNANLGP